MGLCLPPGGFSAIACDSMNRLLHIISWGSGYFNYPIIPTDLMASASVVMKEMSEQCSKGKGLLGESEEIAPFVSPCATYR